MKSMIQIPGDASATTTFGRPATMRLDVTVTHRPDADVESIIDAILDVPGVEGTVHKESPDLRMQNPIRNHGGWDMSLQTKPERPTYRSLLFGAIRDLHIVSLDQIDEVIDAVLSVEPDDAVPDPSALRYEKSFEADGRIV